MLKKIAADIAAQGGRSFYVGGYVRNIIRSGIGEPDKDIDIEVFSIDLEDLLNILSHYGNPKLVGKSFPVIKISGYPEWDFTLPQRPDMSYADACGRRDFTINSMMMDILSGEIVDLYGGRNDIAAAVIKHTHSEVFYQDPLRAYRAVQFAGRFGFTIHPDTLQLISSIDMKSVSNERIFEELRKLLLLSPQPSVGLRYLQTTNLLKKLHPLLFALIGCQQSPVHHPEGDAWEHTLLVVDQATLLKDQSQNPETLMWAALLHDIGKPGTSKIKGNKITTYGHDVLGEKLAISFLTALTSNKALIKEVSLLVREHMHPLLLYKNREHLTDKAVRKLVHRVNLKELLLLAEADFKGRTLPRDFESINKWWMQRVTNLGLNPDTKITPLLRGRDLLNMGKTPSPVFKKILDDAWELQMDGKSKEEIIDSIGIKDCN